MRTLTRRERNLAGILLVTVVILCGLFGLTYLFQRERDLQATLAALRNQRLEANGWLAEKATWEQRREWLDKKQPKLQSIGEANGVLLESLKTSARTREITIVEQAFLEPKSQPAYQEISVRLKVSGSLEAITQWMVELQQPENFQAIPALTMKSDTDPTKVICELTVARWYAARQ